MLFSHVFSKEYVVEARSLEEAARLARQISNSEMPEAFPLTEAEASVPMFSDVFADDRSRTFTCSRCLTPSPKKEWGPGMVRCPVCKLFERSADETAFIENVKLLESRADELIAPLGLLKFDLDAWLRTRLNHYLLKEEKDDEEDVE